MPYSASCRFTSVHAMQLIHPLIENKSTRDVCSAIGAVLVANLIVLMYVIMATAEDSAPTREYEALPMQEDIAETVENVTYGQGKIKRS